MPRDHTGDLVAGLCVIAAACAACAYYVIAKVCFKLLMWLLSLPLRAIRSMMRSEEPEILTQAASTTSTLKRIKPTSHKVETRDVVAGTVHTLKDRKGRKLASILIGTDGIPQRDIVHKDSQEVQQWIDDVVRKQCRTTKRKTKRRARSPRKVL